MRKLLAALIFFIALVCVPRVYADDDFSFAMSTAYTVYDTGITHVEQTVSITNLSEYIYTPSYSVHVGYDSVHNVKVRGSTGPIPFEVTNASEHKKIEVFFVDTRGGEPDNSLAGKYVGKGKVNTFTIAFDTLEIAKERGKTWEVSIPGVSDASTFTSLDTTITVPSSFGLPTVIKPQPKTSGSNPLKFSKGEIGTAGLYILYGSSQIYTYQLTYHISNPNLFPVRTEIALPATTNYQEVVVNSLVPPPENVYRDSDGNWLAEYKLGASGKMDVIAKGEMEVASLPKPETLSEEQRKIYLKNTQFWESNDTLIKKAVATHKTPEQIYQYVVQTLTYDHGKISLQNDRLGAKKSLLNPKNAVCLEFTDLFVAMARSAGIPARAMEGYAYTSNDEARPRSLGNDVLHAWPEYYDDEKKTWIMVDPTWGNTTKGLDFFNNLDFDHIAFVTKGKSSTYPVPAGGYKFNKTSKDVSIAFSENQSLAKNPRAALVGVVPNEVLSAFPSSATVLVKNIGNTPIFNKTLTIQSELPTKQKEFLVDFIPPYGYKEFKIAFEKTPFLTNKTFKVTMLFEGISDTKVVAVRIFPVYGIYIIGGGLIVSVVISIIAIASRRLFIQKRSRESDLRGESKGS